MDNFKQAIESINFDFAGKLAGQYGLHNGFFNFTVTIDGDLYNCQGCQTYGGFFAADCGHDEGICGDVNWPLAVKLGEHDGDKEGGYKLVRQLLDVAWLVYNDF